MSFFVIFHNIMSDIMSVTNSATFFWCGKCSLATISIQSIKRSPNRPTCALCIIIPSTHTGFSPCDVCCSYIVLFHLSPCAIISLFLCWYINIFNHNNIIMQNLLYLDCIKPNYSFSNYYYIKKWVSQPCIIYINSRHDHGM